MEQNYTDTQTELDPNAVDPNLENVDFDTSTPDHDAADPLKRGKGPFTWKSFGGDGLLFSLIFHAALILIAVFWVVSRWVTQSETDPDAFVTGAGGGNNGNEAKIQEHRMKPKNAREMVKTQNRIASKSATATLALPDMPMTAATSFDTGMKAGGDSSGFGGGSGGGIGSGQGIGVGNGRNFVSAFGARGVNVQGLTGYFYDLKMDKQGGTTSMSPGSGQDMYVQKGRALVKSKWNSEKTFGSYFKAQEPLIAAQLFIPPMSANAAPQAFGLSNQGSRWYIHYSGIISPNKSGRIRLVGTADDILAVRFNGKMVLDCGFDLMSNQSGLHSGMGFGGSVLGSTERWRCAGFGQPWRKGPWFEVKKGSSYTIDVLLGETPGGVFFGALCFDDGSGVKLMRFSKAELPKEVSSGAWTGEIDMSGGDWEFAPKTGRKNRF